MLLVNVADPDHAKEIVGKIVAILVSDLDTTMSETELARRVGYSKTHIRRTFLAVTGETLASFTRRMRLERAAGKLSLGSEAVGAVAAEALYASPKAFCRAFGERFECSPASFRELNSGAGSLLPGFYLAAGQGAHDVPSAIGIRASAEALVTFLYDGFAYGGKLSSAKG